IQVKFGADAWDTQHCRKGHTNYVCNQLGPLNTHGLISCRVPDGGAEHMDEQDRTILQNLEMDHRASLIGFEQVHRRIKQDASSDVGQSEVHQNLSESAIPQSPTDVTISNTSSPTDPFADNLVGSAPQSPT